MIIVTKFSVGDVVWHASAQHDVEKIKCPDCNGTGEWEVVSPAREKHVLSCPRCCSNSLSRELYIESRRPSVRKLTIGSVSVDTHSADRPIRYMCQETGVGSGSIYYEDTLHEHEQDAINAAELQCVSEIAKIEAKPFTMLKRKLAAWPKTASEVLNAEIKMRDLAYSYSDLKQKIRELPDTWFPYDTPISKVNREQLYDIGVHLIEEDGMENQD